MIVARQGYRGFGRDWSAWEEQKRYWGCDDDLNDWEEAQETASAAYYAKYQVVAPEPFIDLVFSRKPCGRSQLMALIAEYGPPHPGDSPSIEALKATPQPQGGGDPGALLAALGGQQGKIPGWVWGVGAGVGGLLLLGVMAVALRRPAARAA